MDRTDKEINELHGDATETSSFGNGQSRFDALSYEDGIIAVLDWLLDDGSHPLEE